MKHILIVLFCLSFSTIVLSQNTGINTASPTNTLHIVPLGGTEPLRIEGLNTYSINDTMLLITNNATGVVRSISYNELSNIIKDKIDTDIDSMYYLNDTLYLLENNVTLKTKISLNTTLVDSLIYAKFDSAYHFTTDSILNDSSFASLLDSVLNIYGNNIYFNDSSYALIIDSLLNDTSTLNAIADSIDSDIDSVSFANDTIYIYEDGKVFSTYINTSLDTNIVNSLIIAQSDSLYTIITDSINKDTLWIKQLDSLLSIHGDTVFFNDSSYTLITDSLLNDTNFLNALADSIDSDIDSVTFANDTIYIHEDGKTVSAYINTSLDTALVNSLIIAQSDSLYTIIADSLTNDTSWIKQVDSLLSIYGDTVFFNDSSYTLITDSLLNDTNFLNTLTDSIDSDVDSLLLSGGTTLTIYENGKSFSVYLEDLDSTNELIDTIFTVGDSIVIIEGSDTNYALINDNDWNINANGTGLESAPGGNNIASGLYALSAGDSNIVTGDYSAAFGKRDTVNGRNSTISGGFLNKIDNNFSSISGGEQNKITGTHAFIGGGIANTVSNNWSVITGGNNNSATGSRVFVGAGRNNIASGASSLILGGRENSTSGELSIVVGGRDNTATNIYSTVVGGLRNNATGEYTFLGGGIDNISNGNTSTVSGGENDTASGDHATVGGGFSNTASATYSFIGGGSFNKASDNWSIVTGGNNNSATGSRTFVGGGRNNTASGRFSLLVGGRENISSGEASTLVGGRENTSTNDYSSVLGGYNNNAIGEYTFIGGGRLNTASGDYSTVFGGQSNTASGAYSISGGQGNTASGDYSALSGGTTNTASGDYSTISGGRDNTASGYSSVLSGGNSNITSGDYSSLTGGNSNITSGYISTVSGGGSNTASVRAATVSGGESNSASGSYSTVSGGFGGTVSGSYSSLTGGRDNIASGFYSTVSGGRENTASSFGEWVGGLYSTQVTGNATSFIPTDRLFVIGNGTSNALRSNALTLLKDGRLGLGVDGNANQTTSLHIKPQTAIEPLRVEDLQAANVNDTAILVTNPADGTVRYLDLDSIVSTNSLALVDADGDTKIQVEETADDDQIRFDTRGSERMVIDTNGFVGIGFNNPNRQLVVGGTGQIGLNGVGSGIVYSNGSNIWDVSSNGTGLSINETGVQSRAYFATGGNVGIGTTNPSEKLAIKSNNINRNVLRIIASGNTNPVVDLTEGSAGQGMMQIYHNNGVRSNLINGNGISYFNGGNIGIGVITPVEKLHINAANDSLQFDNLAVGNLANVLMHDPTTGKVVTGSISNINNSSVSIITANLTLAISNEVILVNASSGAVTVTLPTAVGNTGKKFRIKKYDASANNLIVNTTGAQTIDGVASQTTNVPYNGYVIISDGTNWAIVGKM